MSNTELKPCPFCGSEARIETDSDRRWVYVTCPNCKITTKKYYPTIDKCATDEAITAWNARITEGYCPTCARNADNRTDGKTHCPIQEHYSLLKDGFCHLYVKAQHEGE